jgi:4'-phosphopantetheinyl transferase
MSEQSTCFRRTVRIILLEHEPALDDDQLLAILDWPSTEFDHASRFRHQGAKTSWCLSRWLLHDEMAELFGIHDADRRLSYGKYGKPFISGCDIHFNWSHTEGCVALVIALGAEVGVDIECIGKQYCDYLDIAKNLFLASECEWIGLEPGQTSWERFLSIFVQKEAWLKATGHGLGNAISEAPAALKSPPYNSSGRILLEIDRKNRYFLACDASLSGMQSQFVVEYRNLPKKEQGISARQIL